MNLSPIADHLWQSTLFAAAAGLLTLALRKNPARVRHWLWIAASYKFLVPLSVLIALSGSIAPVKTPLKTQSSLAVAMDQAVQPFTSPSVSLPLYIAEPQAQSRVPSVLLGIWAFGFLGITVAWWVRWRRIRAAVRAGSPLDLEIPIPARSSRTLLEPGVCGVFRPILLLPDCFFDRLTPEQWKGVIAHELCHVRHKDNLAAAIHMLVESVFWFHPLVWWIGKRMVEERERACDEEVLRILRQPKAYAEGILNVCKLYVESPLTCVSGVSGSNLKKRIEVIMSNRMVLKLNLARKLALAIAGMAALVVPIVIGVTNAPSVRAQSAPKFDVASIKPCPEGRGGGNTKMGSAGGSPIISPGRLNTGCALLAGSYPLAGLIQRVYGRLGLGHVPSLGSSLPISGGPAWIYSDYYVINAEAAGNASKETMEGPMLQALLEDRFKLKVHRESRQVPVYELTVAKGGPKLQPADGSCTQPDYSTWPMPPLPAGKRYCVNTGAGGRKGPNTMLYQEDATVDYVCKLLTLVMDRPVIDKTGLTGKYKFHLEFAIDQSTPGVIDASYAQPSDAAPAPSIFTVVQQELGLKLEATKGPRDFLVIDHVERPSEN
jgi:bla regulator protein BlaR1